MAPYFFSELNTLTSHGGDENPDKKINSDVRCMAVSACTETEIGKHLLYGLKY